MFLMTRPTQYGNDRHPEPGIPVQMGTPVDSDQSGREVLASVEVPDFRGQRFLLYGILANLGLAEGNLWPEYSTIYGQGQIIEQNLLREQL